MTEHNGLVESAYGWLRVAAAGFRSAYGGRAPAADELVAEGSLVLLALAERYDVSHGATFATFCSPYVTKRWERMRRRELREPPAGGWEEMLGLMRTEGTVMGPDAEHSSRADGITDALLAVSILTPEQLDAALDLTRFFAFIDELPEPQRSLLRGLYHDGKPLTVLARELGLKRATARRRAFSGMQALVQHFGGGTP